VAKRSIDPKADRKRKLEQLKREQRAKERRKTWTTVGIATLLGLGLIAAVVVPSVLKSRRTASAKKAAVATLGVATAAAECTDEKVDSPLPAGSQHVGAGEKVTYPTAPPDGGQHDGTASLGVGTGFYSSSADAPPELAVHSLEHGAIIGWYDTSLPKDQQDVLRKIATASTAQNMRLIFVPWDRGTFPDNKHFVLTSWGHTQRCGKVSGAVIDAFAKKNTNSKDAPEAGGVLG
jgi:hypothetical protein